MRTTIEFDSDTAAAVRALQSEGKSVSEAVNELIRRGMQVEQRRGPFAPRTRPLGIKVDVSNVAEAVERLEGPTAR